MTAQPSRRLLSQSLLLTLTLFPETAFAQPGKGDWGHVQKLKPGSKLVVKTKTNQKVEGKATVITPDSITLSLPKVAGQEVELRRGEVAEVRKKSGARTAGYATLLGGVGAAGGYGIGYGVGAAKDARFRPEYPTAAVGAAVGVVVGVIIGSRGEVVYQAP
jgi:hypothetical protein